MTAEVLEYLARSLVDHPDEVSVTETEDDDGELVLELRVHPDDMGKVIGKRGRTAKAIRTMVKAAGTRDGTQAIVEIVE
ncbi:MAG: KH domain-containing protein [Egibacteraceae bacterium]